MVSCAGIGLAARIVGRSGVLSSDVFEKTLKVNSFGTYFIMSHTARAMAELDPVGDSGECGVITNTSSVAWQDGQNGQAAYAASQDKTLRQSHWMYLHCAVDKYGETFEFVLSKRRDRTDHAVHLRGPCSDRYNVGDPQSVLAGPCYV